MYYNFFLQKEFSHSAEEIVNFDYRRAASLRLLVKIINKKCSINYRFPANGTARVQENGYLFFSNI